MPPLSFRHREAGDILIGSGAPIWCANRTCKERQSTPIPFDFSSVDSVPCWIDGSLE